MRPSILRSHKASYRFIVCIVTGLIVFPISRPAAADSAELRVDAEDAAAPATNEEAESEPANPVLVEGGPQQVAAEIQGQAPADGGQHGEQAPPSSSTGPISPGSAGSTGPTGPPPDFVCIGQAIIATCLVVPADGADANSFPEGQLPIVGTPAEPAPYVPSQAEIDATIQSAYSSAPFPDFTLKTAPPGDLDAPLITQLATFLWVDDAQWQPIAATASIPGYLTVTVTAVPTTMKWSGGETGPITCDPPGIEWSPGAPENCTMTYKSSSATNNHTLTLETIWEVSYACSAYCSGGTLPPVTRTDTRDVRVAEIQAIVTAGG